MAIIAKQLFDSLGNIKELNNPSSISNDPAIERLITTYSMLAVSKEYLLETQKFPEMFTEAHSSEIKSKFYSTVTTIINMLEEENNKGTITLRVSEKQSP